MFKRDPRAAEYPWQSPYVYHMNSPVWQIDYLGGGGGTGAYSRTNNQGENSTVYVDDGTYVGKDGAPLEKFDGVSVSLEFLTDQGFVRQGELPSTEVRTGHYKSYVNSSRLEVTEESTFTEVELFEAGWVYEESALWHDLKASIGIVDNVMKGESSSAFGVIVWSAWGSEDIVGARADKTINDTEGVFGMLAIVGTRLPTTKPALGASKTYRKDVLISAHGHGAGIESELMDSVTTSTSGPPLEQVELKNHWKDGAVQRTDTSKYLYPR